MHKKSSGNILFLILIAVALFAALSYAITSTNRTNGSAIENEKAKISEGELNFYLAQIEQGKDRLTLINDCTVINYTIPADQTPTGDKSCHLFHPDGGGVIWRDFGNLCPSDDFLNALAVGERCGAIVYAGDLSGTRLYTTVSDQGSGISWNNGSSNWTTTSATSTTDGKANTDILVGLSDASSPYNAANACRALGPEWYLPALNELGVIFTNKDAIGGLNDTGAFPDGRYWTSTQHTPSDARNTRFSDGNEGIGLKSSGFSVRCIRR